MNTTDTTVLTPAQFTAARALALAFHHTWGMVPDGTYDVETINKIASQWEHPDLPGGIDAPSLDDNGNVVHSTGTGRLHWTVSPDGDVTLKVYRPSAASKFAEEIWHYLNRDEELRSQVMDAFNHECSYDSAGNIADTNGQLVASLIFKNNDPATFDIIDKTAVLIIDTNDERMRDRPHMHLLNRWEPKNTLDVLQLFERHVNALVRPLVALQEASCTTDLEHDTDEYRQEIIYPAIAQAIEWLAPLYEIALPDPYWQREGEEPPTSYYIETDNYNLEKIYSVKQGNDSFPVESEKTAVNAVLRLRKDPELSLIDAVKAAIQDHGYRPFYRE